MISSPLILELSRVRLPRPGIRAGCEASASKARVGCSGNDRGGLTQISILYHELLQVTALLRMSRSLAKVGKAKVDCMSNACHLLGSGPWIALAAEH